MKLPLKGIIPPVITPLLNYDKLDDKGLEKLLEHLLSGGVHGLFILGTNGEAPSLSYEIREELIKKVCEIVDKKVPVLVGISDTSIEGALKVAGYAKKYGADAVVVAPPYYFPISQSEMLDFLEVLAPQLPLPFLLYNMPSCTKINLNIESVKRAKELGAIGVKDSSGDMFFIDLLIEEFKDDKEFSIFSGTELFLPETIMHGGHGAVAGGANFYPRFFVDAYNAASENDLETLAPMREIMLEIYNKIYSVGKHTSRITKGTKCALSVMGICSDYMAPPLKKFNTPEREIIQKYVEEFNNINIY